MNPLLYEAFRIRRMAPSDLDRVIEIALTLPEAPHWPRSAYLDAVDPEAAPPRIALVAENPDSGAIQGFTVASLLPPQAELEMIAVAAEWQRRGVARQLFLVLVEALNAEHVTELLLEVRDSNSAALAFYRAIGFAIAGRRPRYYADPVEDAALLELRLA